MNVFVCSLFDVKNSSGKVSTTIVTCEVVMMHIMKDVLDDKGHIDIQKYRPVSRLGGNRFSNVREGWDLPRPKYQKPGDEMKRREPPKVG